MTEQSLTLEQAFAQAVAHHQAGRLQPAETLYRAILGAVPDHPDSNHNLGILALQAGQPSVGLPLLKMAHEHQPDNGRYWRSYLDGLIGAGRGFEASRVLQQARRHGVKNEELRSIQAKIVALGRSTPAPDVTSERSNPSAAEEQKLLTLLGQQRIAEALSVAQTMTRQYPKHPFAWKVCGALLSSQGKNDEALQRMQTAAQLAPGDVEAQTNVGAMYQLLGRFNDAEQSYRQALALVPDHAEAHANLGIAQHDLGKLADAESSYRRAIALKPDYAKAYNNLGVTLRALGRVDEAIQAYHKAIDLNPRYAEAFLNLAVVQGALKRLDESKNSVLQAIALRPDYAEAHLQLGKIEVAQANTHHAEASFRRALEIRPDYADAYSSMGELLREIGRPSEAVGCYLRAVELNPSRAADLNNLGSLYQDQKLLDAAAELYARALAVDPGFPHALYNLGQVHELRGNLVEARECYRRAHERGYSGARIKEALLLPPLIASKEEMLRNRQSLESRLDALLADVRPIPDPLNSGGSTNFYLAYHGLNDKDIQVKVAALYERSCPSLVFTSPHCDGAARRAPGPIRIGFFSRYLSKHSVSTCFSKVLEEVSHASDFEVTLLSCCPISEDIYAGAIARRIMLPLNLKVAQQQVAALRLDILVYLDIGMEPFSYFLAFARLAAVQCVLGGHPVTSGIPNMDYFISSGLMEPEAANEHYSERLVLLDRPLYYFDQPELPACMKSRAELGLPATGRLYMCPMRLQKLHPDFDAAIHGILRRDMGGFVVLFEDVLLPFGRQLITERLARSIPADLMSRVLFLPWLTEIGDFMSAVATADVIIDPFHFGIGSTSAVTSAVGAPVVTMTGEFMRGRVGTAYCRMLGVEECIVGDLESYVRVACAVANDAALRADIKYKILKNNRDYYGNMKPIRDLMNWFHQVGSALA